MREKIQNKLIHTYKKLRITNGWLVGYGFNKVLFSFSLLKQQENLFLWLKNGHDFAILLQLVYDTAEPIGFEKLNYFNQ